MPGEPADLSPYAKFAAPYDLNYTHPNIYSGAGRDLPEPKDITEVRIGFFGPIEHNPDAVFGQRMLHGAQMAVDEANARGGYGGKPFRLMLHNDYDNWQAKAVYGDDRPTDPTIWGSASNETVKMVYDDQDWAIFGSISSEATHIALRVALRAEIPIVNSASTDPTIPETYIPVVLHRPAGRPRAVPHACAPRLHGTRPQACRHSPRQQSLWPLWRHQAPRRCAPAGPSHRHRAEVPARRQPISRAS